MCSSCFSCCWRGHRLGGAWRSRLHSWRQHLWPFGQLRWGSQSQAGVGQVTTLKSRFPQISLLVFGRVKGSGKRGMIIINHDIAVLCLFEPPTLICPQKIKEEEEEKKLCGSGLQTETQNSSDTKESIPRDRRARTGEAQPDGPFPGDPGTQTPHTLEVSLSNLRL